MRVKESYSDYLKSPHWRKFRKMILIRNKFKCQVCESGINLHVHHLTYDNIGRERLEDVMVLCGQCHKRVHTEWLGIDLRCLGRKARKKAKNDLSFDDGFSLLEKQYKNVFRQPDKTLGRIKRLIKALGEYSPKCPKQNLFQVEKMLKRLNKKLPQWEKKCAEKK